MCPCPRTCVHVQTAASSVSISNAPPLASTTQQSVQTRAMRHITLSALDLLRVARPRSHGAVASFGSAVDLSLDAPSSSSIISSFPLLPLPSSSIPPVTPRRCAGARPPRAGVPVPLRPRRRPWQSPRPRHRDRRRRTWTRASTRRWNSCCRTPRTWCDGLLVSRPPPTADRHRLLALLHAYTFSPFAESRGLIPARSL